MNMTSYRKNIPFLTYTFILLLICMTAANAYLVRVNSALRGVRASLVTHVPVGHKVSLVSGVDFQNRPITLDPSMNSATVLLVYSPTCPYCEKNWPTWTSIIDSVPNQKVDFAVVDLTGTATADFIAKKKPGRAKLIHRLDPKDFENLDLTLTPQTIVIGPDSKVSKVWTGVLSQSDIAELDKLLS